jgi:hypothetical protein
VKSDHCSNTVFWNVLFRLKIPTALRIQYSSRETCQDESVLSSSREEPCGNHIIHKPPGWVTRAGYRRQMTLYLSAFYGKVAFCSPLSHVVCGWRLPPWYLCDTCKFLSFIDSIPRAFTIVTPHNVTLCGVTRDKFLNILAISLKLNHCPKCMILCRFWPKVWKLHSLFLCWTR